MITDADRQECERFLNEVPLQTLPAKPMLCSWCGRWFDENNRVYLPPQPIPVDQVSHTICIECAKVVIRNHENNP